MHIYLNASEIAGLINKNKYNPQEDVIYNILCRVKKEKNELDNNKLRIINKDELIELLLLFQQSELLDNLSCLKYKETIKNSKTDDVSDLSKVILNKVSETSIKTQNTDESKKMQTKIEKNIKKVMKDKNVSKVNEYLTGHINKTRGIVNENKIIQKYEKKYDTKIKDNNSKLYKMKLFVLDNHSIYICGKIDGIENDELIEVKNRRNRLFEFIPLYEQIQTEIYFRLTDLSKGKLIQNYNDTQSIFEIKSSDELWDTIMSELVEASKIIISQL
jgi:hypothetical protein